MDPWPQSVRVFVTGGTFDKEYNELAGTLAFEDTHLPEMLRLGRCRLDVSIQTLMMIDSLDMTDADRALIVRHAARRRRRGIVITHGTDTMVETARALARSVSARRSQDDRADRRDGAVRVRQLRRAVQPRQRALRSSQVLPPGVYIAMNGRCFAWDRVRKNRETGVFENRER